MTKNILKYLMLLPLALLLGSCTHNDGNIGPWFGTWGMTAMTVDGVPYGTTDRGQTLWEFQSHLVRISRIDAHQTFTGYSWGTWEERDGHLLLDFTHPDNSTPEGDQGEYRAPDWLLMPPGQVIDLAITDNRSRIKSLKYTDPDGKIIIYTIKKTW